MRYLLSISYGINKFYDLEGYNMIIHHKNNLHCIVVIFSHIKKKKKLYYVYYRNVVNCFLVLE